MPTRSAKRLLIVGWDAADWIIVRRLFERRAMPNLQRLVESGSHADLSTLEPRLSPLLWTSIATGKTADKHGILNFVEPDPAGDGIRLSSSTTRRTKALWNMLSQSGMRTNVVSWYASHPAEPIDGICVSNHFQVEPPASHTDAWSMPVGAVHPASWADRIGAARVHPAAVPAQTLLTMVPALAKLRRDDERLATLRRHVAQCMSVHGAAMALLAEPKWDCTMVFQEAIDTIGHHFMQYYPPRMEHVSRADHEMFRAVMDGVYVMHDRMLGEMLGLVGPETTVMLLSDHGFFSDHQRPVTANLTNEQRARVEAKWHRPTGVLVMTGPGIARGARLAHASVLDITPTALSLLGLPIGEDMDGRVLTDALAAPAEIERIASWDERTGAAGMHADNLRQDPFEAHSAIQQLIDLGYMAALPESARERLDLVRIETRFNLAMVLLTTGRASAAAPEFESLVQANPHESRYAIGLARSHMACLRPADAAAALTRFFDHDPGNSDARALLAAALITTGRHEEAGIATERLERDAGDRAALAQTLGDLQAALRNWESAERHYARALMHDHRSAAAHTGLARIALARGQYEQAAGHCLDALDLQHATPDAHHLLGVALAWMNDLDHAAQSFQIALSLQPGRIEAHRFLAAISRRQGNEVVAAEHDAAIERLLRTQATTDEQRAIAMHEDVLGPSAWARHGL